MKSGSVSNGRTWLAAWVFGFSLLLCLVSSAQRVRLMAANTTSGNGQSYLEPGIRIFQGLQPDIVMIQEFKYGNNSTATIQGFVTDTFGPEFSYFRESVGNDQIPNGVISRYPILAAGEWDDTQVSNSRDFVWARIDIPGPKDLWVVSVHMLTDDSKRPAESVALRNLIQLHVPASDYLVIGGDFNSDNRTETQYDNLDDIVITDGPYPVDRLGNDDTNAGRDKPYDAILPDAEFYALRIPVVVGSSTFPNGLIADTRVYSPISEIYPAQADDSGDSMMQHMAVVRDFMIPSPTITSTSPLTGGTVGTAISRTLTATGGATPYTWTVTTGSPPTGLSLSSGGVLSGTPGASGTFTFTALVTDGASATASKSFSVTITPTLVIASVSPLAGGTVGTALSRTLTATGGTSPYTWTVTTGSPPTGLSLSSGGVLSGTPTVAATFTFTARVTDNASATASKSFSVTITPTLVVSSVSPLAGGTVGTALSRTLTATGGTSPYTWTVSSGTPPTGLSLSNGGILSGTPTTSGTFAFTALVTDSASATASKSFNVTITPTLVVSSTSPIAGGTVGTALSRTLTAIGGTSPYAWAISSGALPSGLSLSNGGVLSGTPTTAGTFIFTALASDSASATASKSLTVTVTPTLVVSSTSPLTGGTVGTPLSRTLTATGGTSPYVWSVASGIIPDGLTLTSGGVLEGTPTAPDSFTFTALVTDSASATASKSFTVTITPALSISSTSLAAGTVGSTYADALAASGGTPQYIWSVATGDLPGGITLGDAGTLDGTPTTSGNFLFTAQVADSTGAAVSQSFAITVTPALAISSSPPLAVGTLAIAYSQPLTATGGTSPYLWNLSSGSLPPGMTIDGSGVLGGTPTTSGSFVFTARVTDGTNAIVTRMFDLTIREPISGYLESHGLPAESQTLDSDHDGTINLIEFILGGNPISPDPSILPNLVFDATTATLTFEFQVTANVGSVTWKVQSSPDLATWTDLVAGTDDVTITSIPVGTTANRITVGMPTTAGTLHLRLSATAP
ncbi:MAG: putative Ig domain-containing protein [Verrucomicrobiota bacterium]